MIEVEEQTMQEVFKGNTHKYNVVLLPLPPPLKEKNSAYYHQKKSEPYTRVK